MKRFADLSACIAKELKVKETILDGEIVALDGSGQAGVLQLDETGMPSRLLRLRYSLAERP